MSFTFADAITGARVKVNDSASGTYRTQDATMLTFAKKAVFEAVVLRPDLFSTRGTTSLAAGVEQNLGATRAIYLVTIIGIVGGETVEECDYRTMAQYRPGWRQDTAGPAENWMRHPEDVNKKQSKRFMVYPPSLAGQVLEAMWSEPPDLSAVTTDTMAADIFPLDDLYSSAIQHYIAYEVESLNDESARIERAIPHYQQFVALMGANKAVAPRNEP